MRFSRLRIPLLILAIAATALPVQAQDVLDPKEIVDRVDRIMRGDSSHGVVEMSVVTKRWKRTLSLEIWSMGTEKSLIRILKPKKEAGTATLKVEDDIWNYLPKIDRTIRVPSSMMGGAWMGSHFTNDDLVKHSRLVRDYDIDVAFSGEREGVEVWEFELTPLPDAAVVWGKILYQVRQDDLMPVWARYYDEDDELKRTLLFDDYQSMGGRLIPARMRMVPSDKPNEFTQMLYSGLEFNLEISDRVFSLSALRK